MKRRTRNKYQPKAVVDNVNDYPSIERSTRLSFRVLKRERVVLKLEVVIAEKRRRNVHRTANRLKVTLKPNLKMNLEITNRIRKFVILLRRQHR